jgi:hypothetical protein
LAADKYLLPELEKQALHGLERELQRIEIECENKGNVRDIFNLLQLLSKYTERNTSIANQASRLTRAHLVDLFKWREFRASLETDAGADTRELCMKTLEHGHKHPIVPAGFKDTVER